MTLSAIIGSKITDCFAQGETGAPGPRGPEGALGKGVPGEKVNAALLLLKPLEGQIGRRL